MEKRTLFIKPSRSISGEAKLDPVLIARNKTDGIETTITLDTNILISMEKVVNNGNKWASVKKQGLHNLIKLLQRCPPQSVCISPGLALNEMPPGLAQQSREKYEVFCAEHLPGFIDTPNCIYSKYKGKKEGYGYDDLSTESKAVLAISFSCLLYLNLIDNKFKGKPIDKFKKFLDKLENKVDVLSSAEIEIAKYCFAEPPPDCKEIIKIRRKIRNNFLKTSEGKLPKDASEVMSIAFNGACDIRLLQAANITDQNGIDGVRQDSWIATKDKKLVDFCNIFHHVNLDGEAGKYAAKIIHPEHLKDTYWMLADSNFDVRSLMRRSYHESREIEFDMLIKVADEAISDINCSSSDLI
ncbi:hypothetical protein [Microbulbifer sp. JTAC008]|uniref:hypothetical protein n=1 Tax=unclassified Microbulbifer TaxID=2619833 RepID=UPI004039F64E